MQMAMIDIYCQRLLGGSPVLVEWIGTVTVRLLGWRMGSFNTPSIRSLYSSVK